MKTTTNFKPNSVLFLMLFSLFIISCSGDDDAPKVENEEEVITDVKLIFTNNADANDKVEALAKDPDAGGVADLAILNPIELEANKTYTLTFEILNKSNPSNSIDIGEEIEEEKDDHQIFFSFSNNAFSNPTGDGNIDNPAAGAVIYNDSDGNGNPVGLSTTWTTGTSALSGGTFKVRLQHQPGLKTASSTSTTGDTDFELPFVLNIQNPS